MLRTSPARPRLAGVNWHEIRSDRLQGRDEAAGKEGGRTMLWTIFVILLILWILGLVSGYTLSGFIHILLVIAIVILVIRLIQGRPAV